MDDKITRSTNKAVYRQGIKSPNKFTTISNIAKLKQRRSNFDLTIRLDLTDSFNNRLNYQQNLFKNPHKISLLSLVVTLILSLSLYVR